MPDGARNDTGLLLDPVYQRHKTGSGHPECPERYSAVTRALEEAGLARTLPRVAARAANEDDLLLCHHRPYLQIVKHDIARGARVLSTGDTPLSESSFDVAVMAVGGVLAGVDAVFHKKVRNAFIAVRPPGHHATPARGMGFCLFNNIAIGARYAIKAHGAERVLIADWDVHHGNGTQDTFYEDPSVFFFSTHQYPWYPGTGAAGETGSGAGAGTTMNCPFPAGAGRAELLGAVKNRLLPAANAFKPDLVMISAGFDSRRGDPLGRFLLKDDDFAEMTSLLMEVADKHCAGRVVSVLEGGYDLSGLARATVAHVEALRT